MNFSINLKNDEKIAESPVEFSAVNVTNASFKAADKEDTNQILASFVFIALFFYRPPDV